MSVVNGQSNSRPLRDDRWLLAGVGSGVLLHRAGDGALRRRFDQALIRGLGTAFRVFVSGLVLCLEGGRRAQPGHVALMSVVNGQSNSRPLQYPRSNSGEQPSVISQRAT